MFWKHFATYGAMVSAIGAIRAAIGQLDGFMGWLAWEAVYMPLCAVLALVLAYRTKD